MRIKNKKQLLLPVLGTILILLTIILRYHQVDNSLTGEDIEFIGKIRQEMNVTPISNPRNYEDEIILIVEVQNAVLGLAPENLGIPYNAQREPRDVFLAKSGLCYDRSRVIEKVLRYSGFQTRHIAIYSTEQTHSSFQSLITPGISSHAVTEVLTSKGWLIVDSNDLWVSLEEQGSPASIEQIQTDVGSSNISWAKPLPNGIYKKPFAFVYGLYSRHGRFYPPYNFIPDVNYKEFIQNVL